MTAGSEPHKSVILYSAPCATVAPYGPEAGNSILVKVSQVSVETRQMTPEEVQQALEYLNKGVDVTKALIEIGSASLEFLKNKDARELWQDRLKILSGVGDIIQGILMFIPKAEDPMVTQIRDLADNVEKLGDKVSQNLSEMKALITEVNFFVNILSPTFVLARYMRDCLKNPGPNSKENFTKAYKRHPPMKLAYNLMSAMEQKSTNPLRTAMDAEKAKTKTTFQRWKDIISLIMGQFLLLEAFAIGLLKNPSKRNLEILMERSVEVFDEIEEWRKEYEKNPDDSYWHEVGAYFSVYLRNHQNLSNSDKATGMQKKLETYFTTDAFYVFVFNECPDNSAEYCFFVPKEDVLMHCYRFIGGCHAFIYRSRTAHTKNKEDFLKIRDRVRSCVNRTLTYTGRLYDAFHNELSDVKASEGFGLLFLVHFLHSIQYRSVNCPYYVNGPGCYESIYMKAEDYSKQAHWFCIGIE